MTDLKLEIMELELKQLKKEKEIAEYKLNQSSRDYETTDEHDFKIVKSGNGYATIMPNGIRLSTSKCTPYKSISFEKDGRIKTGRRFLPITVDELIKFNNLLDVFPNGDAKRAVWCEKHFNRSITVEPIIYNIFIGTFDAILKEEPILIIGE